MSKYNESDIQKITDVAAAIAAGAAIGEPHKATVPGVAESAPYALVPAGYSIESLERFLPDPLRVIQNVSLQDAESFIEYLKTFAEPESRIFFDAQHEAFTGILDYHAGLPGWCDHVAKFTAQRSLEFTTWMSTNRKQMTQVEFARFLEENLPDVVEPNSAELLQVALTFEAKRSVEFSSGVRLANGQIQFQFDETIRGAAQKGTIEIPEQFVLGISIHTNGPAYRIPVRLRWRLQESKLTFWYEIVRPHKFIEDALREILARVAQETGIAVLAGARAK